MANDSRESYAASLTEEKGYDQFVLRAIFTLHGRLNITKAQIL